MLTFSDLWGVCVCVYAHVSFFKKEKLRMISPAHYHHHMCTHSWHSYGPYPCHMLPTLCQPGCPLLHITAQHTTCSHVHEMRWHRLTPCIVLQAVSRGILNPAAPWYQPGSVEGKRQEWAYIQPTHILWSRLWKGFLRLLFCVSYCRIKPRSGYHDIVEWSPWTRSGKYWGLGKSH